MIGLFDSGVGGLTVLKEVQKKLPKVKLIYLGDTARTPYGNKSAEVVSAYGVEAARFLVEKGAKIIVVACNTVSAVGIEAIKKEFPKIKVFDVITPAVERVVKLKIRNPVKQTPGVATGRSPKSEIKRVGIMGTRALVNSGIYQKLLKEQGDFEVIARAAPLLVPLVEENLLYKSETKRIVKTYLQPFKQHQIDALVLACTHYPLLKKIIIPRLPKRAILIDPAEETASALLKNIKADELEIGEREFYVTDLNEQTQMIAERWLRQKIKLQKVSL